MKTKLLAFLLVFTLLFSLSACGKDKTSDDTPTDTANTAVPADTEVTLTISKEDGNDTVFGVGVELDPHFFAQNVGLSGFSSDYGNWECKEEDWELFEERMEQMNLKRIRMMLLPSWYVIDEANTLDDVYNWESDEMKSMYRVLDTAKELGIKVCLTMWGVDDGGASFMRDGQEWATVPKPEHEQTFVDCFAACVKYLIEEKGYTNIKEVTLFNEPNSLYTTAYCLDYCNLCKKMNDSFYEYEIRDKVLFNLSDDARDYTWMAVTLRELDGIIDVANSHTYDFGDSYNSQTGESNRDMSNADICYNNATYNLNNWKMYREGYDVPHIWGEFGTQNGYGSHGTYDKHSPSRGLDIPRISLNFFNMGSVGMSYWVLFSQYYNRSEFSNNYIMDMGLWGFADENYNCRPVYYSYSMITRFIEEGDVIFPIESNDDYIVAVAFKNGTEWSYAIVNNSDVDKKVSFVNYDEYPSALTKYVYDEANVPTDNNVIGASGSVNADGRVISDTIKARSFVIYTNK